MTTRPETGAPLVGVRAVVLGVAVVLAGVVPHVAAGGRLPGALALVVILAVAVAAGSRLLTAWAGPLRLVAFVVVAQGAVHAVLSVLAGHRGDPAAAATPAPLGADRLAALPRTGSLQDVYESGLAPTSAVPSQDVLVHQWEHLVEQGPWMALAHALGAAALGLFLARGERALSTLLTLALVATVTRLVAPVRLPRPTPAPAPACVGRTELPLVRASQLLDRSAHPLRGPPLLVA